MRKSFDLSAYPTAEVAVADTHGSLTDAWRTSTAIPVDGPHHLEQRMLLFLHTLADCCHVGRACEASGLSRTQIAAWRRVDSEFAALYEEAEQMGVTALEDEVHRRAFQGVEEPVFHQGEQVGTVTKYSDGLATLLLKAHRPEKYRERQDINVSGQVDIAAVILAARERVGG